MGRETFFFTFSVNEVVGLYRVQLKENQLLWNENDCLMRELKVNKSFDSKPKKSDKVIYLSRHPLPEWENIWQQAWVW